MYEADSAKARKHIDISIKTKHIAELHCQSYYVYVATYTTGKSGQAYQRIEEESGEEFWSIKALTLSPHHRLKDPDLILTQNERVSFLVEVKWGAIQGQKGSDLQIKPEEWAKMEQLFHEPILCRVRGPAVRSGYRYRSSDFPDVRDYLTDNKTKGVLVSDFAGMEHAKLNDFLELWKREKGSFQIADINTHFGEIPSFQEILEGKFYNPNE